MSDDGHGADSEDRVYGKEYAIKVLSKANLDEEALDAQLFEVSSTCFPPLLVCVCTLLIHCLNPSRLPSTRLFAPIRTSSHSTVLSSPLHSCSSSSNSFLERTCSTSSSNRGITSLPRRLYPPPPRPCLRHRHSKTPQHPLPHPPAQATLHPHRRFSRPSTPRTCSRRPDSSSSRACSARCAMRSLRVMSRASFIGISSRRISL